MRFSTRTLETDTSSANTQFLRSNQEKTEDPFDAQSNGKIFKELHTSKGRRFEVTIIEEGLGNFGTVFFYSAEALKDCFQIFEGKKIYANHPSLVDEEIRPERDVKDILGYFENCRYVTEEGRIKVLADVVIADSDSFDWARTLMREAIEFKKNHQDKELVGISINASGDATPTEIEKLIKDKSLAESIRPKLLEAKQMGIEVVNYVNKLTEAVSADLVTEAGAGGKINKMLEGDKTMSTKVTKKKESELPPNNTDKKKDGDNAHPDADQDKALIGDMIKKHLGENVECSDEDSESMHQAYESLTEMGHEKEEAAKMAAAYHKMNKSKKEKEAKEAEDKAAKEKEAGLITDEKKESEAYEKMAGRVAFLEGKLKTNDLKTYVDKKLQESKLPRSVTDEVRKLIGPVDKLKDEKDFDSRFGLFMEGYKSKVEAVEPFFTVQPEKHDPDAVISEMSFEECVK